MDHEELLRQITSSIGVTNSKVEDLKEDIHELKTILASKQETLTTNTLDIHRLKHTISTWSKALWVIFGLIAAAIVKIYVA
jgi:peptidoglycan hydrolase CwlO-like protein